jgi:type I site-specific restriction endonuclease
MATAQLGSLLRHVHRLAAGRGSLQRTDRELLDDFSARRDEAAFAALVARHGPMVLRVCRRVLNHEQDAEDAFDQVTRKKVRPYQEMAIAKTLWEFAQGNPRALLLMATGTGKTFTVFQLVWKLMSGNARGGNTA